MTHLLLILLAFTLPLTSNSWCSPSDSGECILAIRGGRKSKDTDFRTIQFLNHAHQEAAKISVLPSTSTISFWTGGGKQPQLSLDKHGVLEAADVRVNDSLVAARANLTNITSSLLITNSIQSDTVRVDLSITSASSVFGSTNVTGNLLVGGAATFKQDVRVSGKIGAEHVDGRSGSYLSSSGSVEIFSDTNDAHIDFESKAEEENYVVRMSAEKDKLLLHGRHVIVDHQGQVGIGTEATHRLHVNGVIRAASSTITTGSDRRVKMDIVQVDKNVSLGRIAALQVRNFAWHPAYKHTTGQRLDRKTGFIAQELMEVIPEAVEISNDVEKFVDEEGNTLDVPRMHTINMDPVIMDLIGAVQALREEVEILKKECGGGAAPKGGSG
jgi:hypothetical protein